VGFIIGKVIYFANIFITTNFIFEYKIFKPQKLQIFEQKILKSQIKLINFFI